MRFFFVSLYDFFIKHKILLFSILILLIGGLGFLGSQLKLNEDVLSIIPKNPENERINFVFQNLDASDKIIVKINLGDSTLTEPDLLTEQAEIIADSLHPLLLNQQLKEITYKTDESQFIEVLDFMFVNIPYFLNEEDYKRLDSLLTPEKMAELMEENKKMLTSPIGMMYRQTLLRDPLRLTTPFLKELGKLGMNSQYTSYDGYLMSADLKSLFIFLTPSYASSDTYHNKNLIRQLEDILNSIEADQRSSGGTGNSAIHISYFGAAAVAVTNAEQIKKDSAYSLIIALVLIILILMYYFRSIRSLLVLLLPIVFGALFAFAGLSLIKGTISAIAIGTGAIIFGIAIDYSLHFLIHLRQQPSIRKTIKEVSFPLTVGSLTTIGAFLSLLLLKSELLEDFGLFAALALGGTIIFTLIFLPHFFKGDKPQFKQINTRTIWNKIGDYSFENNRPVIISVTIITIILSLFVDKVKFEEDMQKINYMTQEQRDAFNELSHNTTLSKQLTYVAYEGNNMETALQEFEKNLPVIDSLIRDGSISEYQHIGHLLPSKALQKEKIDRWNQFWKNKKTAAQELIRKESLKAGFTGNSFEEFFQLLDKNYQVEDYEYFKPLHQSVLKQFLIHHPEKSVVLSLLYSTPSKAPIIKERISTSENTFCFDTKTLTQNMLGELSFDFDYLLWICGIIVLVFLFISFGRIEITAITFLPMAVAFIWILGLMGIFDIHFNIINIILATFIFGIGDDYSIFIMEGLMYEYSYGKKMLNTYKTAVILSAVTMFIGIGSLIISKHPAMFSLAQVSIIGMISVAIIAYTVAPFIFKWLVSKNGKYRKMPITLSNLLKTVFSFIIFLIGSIILTIIGFFLLTIGGKTKKHKLMYHRCICETFRILSKVMMQVPCEVRNSHQETFEKPGIIISNHQSHLDLLYTLMLSPKIICLTNKWVWNSPFYGWILRYANYYPIIDGIEAHTQKLAKAIEEGYSILIFPEGTRSPNNKILRFHQGAFYLAEKLKVDIIPLMIHGIGDVLPKSEFLLRKGKVTVNVLNRIKPDDQTYRSEKESYKVAAEVRKMYREEYKKLSEEVESPYYYRNLVYHNYIYKGKSIEKHVRKQLNPKQKLAEKILQLPDEGTYHIDNCEYGVFALWAALVKKNLQITATDPDNEKLSLARNCSAIPSNLHYIDFQNQI